LIGYKNMYILILAYTHNQYLTNYGQIVQLWIIQVMKLSYK
jgi:hypothetical protein